MRAAELKPIGNAPARGFDNREFEFRLAAVQAGMTRDSIDLLLLMTEPEVRYFSGFLTQFWQSPTRPWFLLVPASGKPVAVIPAIGAECMAAGWVEDIRTWSSPHKDDDGISLLVDTITELGGNAPRLGMMMGRETQLRMPLADFYRVRDRLPKAEICDVTALVQGLRSVKSSAEIAKIRHAAQIASKAFEIVPQVLSAGMTEIEAFREFKLMCLQLGADNVAYLVGGSGKGGYGDIISPPTDKPLEAGDVLILDVGCLWDGYHCDFDRNYAVGHVDDHAAKAYEIVWEATEAGLAAAKPGVTCSQIFKAMNDHMTPHAIASSGGDVGRLGHGLGMQLTEYPSLVSFDQTVAQNNMVLTLEPGYAYAPGKMMVHEEDIVVRDSGVELLTTRAPKSMPVIV